MTRTSILDAASGDIVAELDGTVPWQLSWMRDPHPVALVTDDGLLAVLASTGACEGIIVHHPALSGSSLCLDGAGSAVFSPAGDRVAFARQVGETGPVEGPGFQSVSMPTWVIGVLDLASGRVTEVTGEAASFDAPIPRWDEPGEYLLVKWPVWFGL